jgi:glycerol-3-phosphate O-acyltransferase
MNGASLFERYGKLMSELTKYSVTADKIDSTNVYQEANPKIRALFDTVVAENILPGTRLLGREHFADFLEQVKAGKRGLILPEHYSNLDLPLICYLLDHDKSPSGAPSNFGPELMSRMVSISGMKLNEKNPLVRACAEAFTRIVVYPSRGLEKVTDTEELARAKKINMAGMRALDLARRNKQAVLVFPAGTRYRPGKPETKRGVREIDSYLRMFDIMLLLSINGNCLRISKADPENMLSDEVWQDKVIVAAGPVIDCKNFRNDVISKIPEGAADIDPKQATVDRVTELLEAQHEHYESIRQQDA